MLGTSNSDTNTVLSPNVSGQWSREFQLLCFPYLDSPDSQLQVLGYSHLTNKKKHQRRRRLTVTFGPRPLRMSWLTCCCCIAVIACGIGLFHMARASNRLTSVQINTTKQFWFVRSCSVFTAPPDAHICLKCAYVFTPSVGYSGSLSTVNETCNNTKDTVQKKMSVHILQVPAH